MDSNFETPNTQPLSELTPDPEPVQISRQKLSPLLVLSGLIIVGLFGIGGYVLGQRSSQKQTAETLYEAFPSATPTSDTVVETAAKEKLETYTSSFEKLSFSYPADWQVVPSPIKSNYPEADTFGLQSPDGTITIAWISAMDGLGGGCNPSDELGTIDACPLYEVVDLQKSDNAAFYYVAYLYTRDGKQFAPLFALQDETGQLATTRGLGYLLFTGKHNGGISAGLKGGSSLYFPPSPTMSREKAMAFFDTPSAQQAKQIILSAAYQ
jgi:hypothetical protein